MAANFQPHMGGPGQMMPQQQQQRPQQLQRGPQNNNISNQIHQMIYSSVQNATGPLPAGSWQASMMLTERITLIFNLIGNLRLASQNQPNGPGLNKMIEIGIRFEKEIFNNSPDKQTYKRAVETKLEQLLERRTMNQAGLQQSITQQAQAQAQQQQQMMMNQNGMQGQGPRPMPQHPAQQGFQHLQHQMQASPLPGQQPQMPMGMTNESLPPNMSQNQHQQFQVPMQQSQQQPQQQQNLDRPQNPQQQLTPQDQQIVMELAHRLMNQAALEEKNHVRAGLQSKMDPQQLQGYQQRGQDPLILYYRQQALIKLRTDKQQRIAQAQQQLAMQQQSQNMQNSATPMQQQRSMNPSPLNGQVQPPASMGGNADFGGFMGNMENIAVQQQQGVIAQEAGQVVVPANGAQRNPTPQPGVMPGQQMGMNDQRGVPNPNNRTQQQQQQQQQQIMMQQQQQRMQAAQQQQAQNQVRMNAQAKAQQMSLQGQPGGMGNGPMPPQQSPAMATLNAPLRTPSQMSQPDASQMNPNPQFGQPLDPRFAQGNRGQLGSGNGMHPTALNPALFPGMSAEQRQRMLGMPPEKLNEVMARWNEQQRAAQANNPNMQAGRPQMPMQGNNQIHPGQPVPPAGQFNPNAANQFINSGQRPPQAMSANMTPQQHLLLQQQIQRLQQNPLQQRNPGMAPNAMPNDPRLIAQMDNVDFPATLLNHPNFPQGIPPEIKKWGLLKSWVQQNPSLGPDVLENMKQFQKAHWGQILKAKAASQPGGVPQGLSGGPAVLPGMSAPVAPMGQNAMHLQNGINGPGQMRQVTQEDINNARSHPSGKMAVATDDQIRNFLMRQMVAQRQQTQAQMMQNVQMQNHMSQVNAQQQQRPGQPQQNPNARGVNQPPQSQTPQPKQAPPGSVSAAMTTNASNAAKATRPTPNPRATVQNSSPAPPQKSLKRGSSSDDVIEITNPNVQQPTRATPLQNQAQQQKQPPQQPRPTLTPQQVAALDPEARKKYEMNAMRARAELATKQEMDLLRGMVHEEMKNTNAQPVVEISMDPETKANVTKLLKEILQPLMNMSKAVGKWYQMTHDEARAREFFRLKTRLSRQFRDAALTQPKDSFSITAKEIEHARKILNGMVKDLSDRFPGMKKSDSTQSQPAPQSTVAPALTQHAPAPTVPLNAANLQQQQQQLHQQQQQQLNKMHQRSNSRSSQAPAAPTSSQPPFPFGARSPPDGIPNYPGKPAVTQETLKFPARKKQKQQNTSTPVAGQSTPNSTASPQVTKPGSPEIKRETKQQPKPGLTCSEPECDKHNVGFESEEALKNHTQEEHIKPLEDPSQFSQQIFALTLGLDAQGQPKKSTTQDGGAPAMATNMSTSGSKQGQTPNFKGEMSSAAGTPMNRQVSMNRQGSAPGARPSGLAKATPSKDIPGKPTGQKEVNKQQANQPSNEIILEDSWANATIDPQDLFQAFQPFETGAGGAISDMNVYRSITPNDTPESSKDGVSEPNSDISDGVALDISLDIFDKWMPFGPTDMDTLFDMNNFSVGKEEDLTMFDDEPAAVNFAWDDMVDTSVFDKQFSFDTSLYSMNTD